MMTQKSSENISDQIIQPGRTSWFYCDSTVKIEDTVETENVSVSISAPSV